MTLYNNITEIVGNTPLVKINKITDGAKANVFAKLEFYNPTSTGSFWGPGHALLGI
jgi:cysteine synthase